MANARIEPFDMARSQILFLHDERLGPPIQLMIPPRSTLQLCLSTEEGSPYVARDESPEDNGSFAHRPSRTPEAQV